MSFAGILSTALAGGAGVIGKQAGDDIEAQRRVDLMRQQSDIEEQRAIRLEELAATRRERERTAAFDFENNPENVNRRAATADTLARAAGKTAQAVQLDALSNTELNAAARTKMLADEAAKEDAHIKSLVAQSRNPELLKAIETMENASPSKRAETAMKLAHAAAYRQSAAGGAGGKADKMAPETLLEYKSALEGYKDALKDQTKFESDGASSPFDKDGKPTQQYQLVQRNTQAAKQRLIEFKMQNGLIDPKEAATLAVSGEQSPEKISLAIEQAYQRGGKAFGDAFYQAVQDSGALSRLAESRAEAGQPGAPSKPATRPMIQTGQASGPVAIAETRLRQAMATLNTYGSNQRQRDPEGFKAAQQRVEEARAALASIQDSEGGAIPESYKRPSIRYAAP